MITEFSVKLAQYDIEAVFKFDTPIDSKKLTFLQKTQSVIDIKNNLDKCGIKYQLETYQFGRKIKL